MKDALNDELFVSGELRKDAKLTEQIVKEIRAKFVPWKYSARALAHEYGVPLSSVTNVIYYQGWKWVK
jgi:hypothetical protein